MSQDEHTLTRPTDIHMNKLIPYRSSRCWGIACRRILSRQCETLCFRFASIRISLLVLSASSSLFSLLWLWPRALRSLQCTIFLLFSAFVSRNAEIDDDEERKLFRLPLQSLCFFPKWPFNFKQIIVRPTSAIGGAGCLRAHQFLFISISLFILKNEKSFQVSRYDVLEHH